ncbi:helix-turn-helix domain-containing protein [Reichenbachiella sp.]
MQFVPHNTSDHLSPFIQSIFHISHFVPDHSIQRVVPTGHIFIIFELDGFVRHTYDNETLKEQDSFTKVWISGMHRNYISISAHQQSEMFVIQFKPFGAYPFFHFPLEELNEKVVQAEKVLGPEILDIREKLYLAKTSQDKFAIAETWLTERFDSQKVPTNDLYVVSKKLQQESVTDYAEAIADYPNTQKHLIDQCKKYLGLTPKYFQRILRFNELLQQIQEKKSVPWSQVAYQCGYSDQSHFIKEFKHFSGFNPKEYIEQEYNQTSDPNFFPLDKRG